jgi:hypothetical protein
LDFSQWLNDKSNDKVKAEREEVESRITQDSSPTVIAREMYLAYKEIYGVKSSFYRFIDEVLDKELQERLFSSVQVEKITDDGRRIIIDKPKKKKDFLFQSRNLFTHYLKLTGTYRRGLFLDTVLVEGQKIKWSYEQVLKHKSYFYSVRRWPFELFEIISSVIGKPMEIYDFDLDCQVIICLEPGNLSKSMFGRVKLSSLKDLNKINEEALRLYLADNPEV